MIIVWRFYETTTYSICDKSDLLDYFCGKSKTELLRFAEELKLIRINNLSKNKLASKITTHIINQRGYALLRNDVPFSY